MVKPGLKGLTNETLAEIRAFIVDLLVKDEMSTLDIMAKCNRKFGTNDNQIRAMLIYMMRDGYVYLNDWGEYGLRGVDYKATPVKSEPTEPFAVPALSEFQYSVLRDDHLTFDDLIELAPDGVWLDEHGNEYEIDETDDEDDWEDDGDDPFAWLRRWGWRQ